MRIDPNLCQDLQVALQLCAVLYFKHVQIKHSGRGGWHKAWANIFTMQTSEPQITSYLIIGFLQVLLAPKGQLLTAQLSPLTLIKVFLGSWLWWAWRTLKFGFCLNLLFSPGGVFLKTPNLWTFQYILQDTFVYTFDRRWRHSINPQVEIILLASLYTVCRRIWDYLLRNLLPKIYGSNINSQVSLSARGGVDFSSCMTDDVTKCDRECSCWSRNKEVLKTRDRTQK